MTQEEILSLMHTDADKGIQAVVRQYGALVYKIAWAKLSSVCTKEDVEETVSDVFLDFYKNFGSVDFSKGSLTSFIAVLAQRRAVDTFRKALRQKNIEAFYEGNASAGDFSADTVLESEERSRLIECINALDKTDRTIIFRKYYFGETYNEIGYRLGMSENAVNKRCLRAVEKLSRMMKGENSDDR